MTRPVCFLLMPRGMRDPGDDAPIDLDAVRTQVVIPAIEAAGMQVCEADEFDERQIEHLLLSEFAVVDAAAMDLATFHAFGLRDASKAGRSVVLASVGEALPADIHSRVIRYRIGPDGQPQDASSLRQALTARLATPEPEGSLAALSRVLWGFEGIARLKTDVFRERVDYAPQIKARLAQARGSGAKAVKAIEDELAATAGGLQRVEAAVLVDLLLSWRATGEWARMIALVEAMPAPLAGTLLVREQLGLALHRAGRSDEAETLLTGLIDTYGSSSETCALLGRIYKDRSDEATQRDDPERSRRWLDQAIESYLRGFESDWRDAYPGINAVTLMTLRDPPDERAATLLPVVTYAVQRRIANGRPDYWDHATLVELAVHAESEAAARAALGDAVQAARERWEPESTARNLRLIREARARRGRSPEWAEEVERALLARAAEFSEDEKTQ